MKDYKKLSREELRAICSKRGLEINSDPDSDELLEAIVTEMFAGLTKAELIAECNARGFDVKQSAKKEEILGALISVVLDQPEILFEEEAEEPAAESKTEPLEEELIVEKTVPELPPENPGYPDGYVEDDLIKPEPLAEATRAAGRRAVQREAAREARAKRRENIAKIETAANMTAADIDRLAYGSEQSYSPRTLRNAPRNLSIEGDRIRQIKPGEQDDFELVESMNNSAYVITGEVKTILPPRTIRTTHPDTGEPMLCVNATAVVEYGDRLVYIPSKYFFEDYYNMPQERIREYMQGRLGSDIDFKVVRIDRQDPENPLYTGSRISAMRKKRCDFWYSERAKGRSLIQPGSIQQARVVAVSERLVFVEIFGAEIKVEPKEIAYEYVVDARDYYVPGDVILVRIKSVTLQDKDRAAALGYPVDCEVSIKDVYEDPKKAYFDKQMWHSAFKGTVVNIDIGKDNAVNIFVNDGRIDILCHLGDGITKMPERGDTVIGKITGMNEQTGFVWGIINHINPSRQERRSRPESFIQRK